MCMMFIDIPNSHSFVWDGVTLRPNESALREGVRVQQHPGSGCPAMALVNPTIASMAEDRGKFIECMYEKELLLSNSDLACVANVAWP